MIKKTLTTFEREMQDTDFKKSFNKEYKEFLLSELISSLMEKDNKSVRKLAEEAGLSPSIIQNLRSGKQDDLKLTSFINITHSCGYEILLKKGKELIHVGA